MAFFSFFSCMQMSQRDELIRKALDDTCSALLNSIETCKHRLSDLVQAVVQCMQHGGKLLLFGNGGSAADAQHIAAEFVNRFRLDRSPLAAIALTTDTSILTSVANDFSYDQVFSKQVEALASQDDMVMGISTSGNSRNVVRGLETARGKGAFTVGFTGMNPGAMGPFCDILIDAQTSDTPRIQEVHIFMAHIMCDLVEKELFESGELS